MVLDLMDGFGGPGLSMIYVELEVRTWRVIPFLIFVGTLMPLC